MSEAHFNVLSVEAHGQASLASGKDGPFWQGKLSAYSPDIARTLRMAGMGRLSVPPSLNRIEVEARFRGTPDTLTLREIRAKTDQSVITGTLNVDWREQPALHFKLNADQINLDRYMSTAPAGKSKAGSKDCGLPLHAGLSRTRRKERNLGQRSCALRCRIGGAGERLDSRGSLPVP